MALFFFIKASNVQGMYRSLAHDAMLYLRWQLIPLITPFSSLLSPPKCNSIALQWSVNFSCQLPSVHLTVFVQMCRRTKCSSRKETVREESRLLLILAAPESERSLISVLGKVNRRLLVARGRRERSDVVSECRQSWRIIVHLDVHEMKHRDGHVAPAAA